MADDHPGQTLRDAAVLHAARRDIRAAAADLATRPLNEAAAERLRELLSGQPEAARAALHRLSECDTAPPVTHLSLVPDSGRAQETTTPSAIPGPSRLHTKQDTSA